MEAYRNLKAERPQYMVGVGVTITCSLWRGCENSCAAVEHETVDGDIPGVGVVPVRAFLSAVGVLRQKTLTGKRTEHFLCRACRTGRL